MPYSESPRTNSQSGQIVIKIRRNLTCFRPVQSFSLTCILLSSHSLSHSYLILISLACHSLSHSHLILIHLAPMSISSHSHRTLISFSFHSHLTLVLTLTLISVRWCKILSINRTSNILVLCFVSMSFGVVRGPNTSQNQRNCLGIAQS